MQNAHRTAVAAVEGRKAVAVIDRNLAPGLGGITYQEIAVVLYDSPARPALLSRKSQSVIVLCLSIGCLLSLYFAGIASAPGRK